MALFDFYVTPFLSSACGSVVVKFRGWDNMGGESSNEGLMYSFRGN